MNNNQIKVALLLVTLSSAAASANWRRQSGFFCMSSQNNSAWEANPTYGMMSRTNAGNIFFKCPLIDDSHIDREAPVTKLVNVHVFNNSGTWWFPVVQTCAQSPAVDGVACSNAGQSLSVAAGTAGQITVADKSGWSFNFQYAYLDIIVAENCGIVGYFFAM